MARLRFFCVDTPTRCVKAVGTILASVVLGAGCSVGGVSEQRSGRVLLAAIAASEVWPSETPYLTHLHISGFWYTP